MLRPVILSDVISTLSVNETRGFPNQLQLQNPTKEGMWLDEVRISFTNGKYGTTIGPADLWVKLTHGERPLTREFVPAFTLGPMQAAQENDTTKPVFTWRLKYPYYVPPNEYVQAEVKHASTYRRDAHSARTYSNVRITYVGRSIPKNSSPPVHSLWRPWVVGWSGTVRTTAAKFTEQTREANIYNPYDRPIFVERFNARFSADGLDQVSQNSLGGHTDYQSMATNTLVRAEDSDGRILVRDPTPFDVLFTNSERSWRVHSYLRAGGFYIFRLAEDFSDLSTPYRFAPHITMVSYAQVA